MPGKKRSKVEIELNKIKSSYFSWRKVKCPALGREVEFTRAGWDHLFVNKKRPRNEYIMRARLLPFAKKIIQSTTTIQEYRLQDQRITPHLYTSFIDTRFYGKKLKVVVVEDKKKIYFHSVYLM